MFSVQACLEPFARVTAVGIPAHVRTVEQVIAGLDSIALDNAVLLGHSLGGLIAQAYATQRRERVAGLVLANSAFYLGRRARLLPRAARILAALPGNWLALSMRLRIKRLVANAIDAEFWSAFYQRELAQPDAAAIVQGQFALMHDLLRHLAHAPALPDIPVQIIASEDDTGFTRQEIAYLASLYPRSRTLILGAGRTLELCHAPARICGRGS